MYMSECEDERRYIPTPGRFLGEREREPLRAYFQLTRTIQHTSDTWHAEIYACVYLLLNSFFSKNFGWRKKSQLFYLPCVEVLIIIIIIIFNESNN